MDKSMVEHKIIDINSDNIENFDIFCYKTQKGKETYQKKITWLKKQFPLGLKFKIIVVNNKSKLISKGFIEYIPGKFSWRGISADNYMVIHCIWIEQSFQGKGLGNLLLNECLKDAKNMNGIAVITSQDPWLPSDEFFTRNGFKIVDTYKPKLKLMLKKNKDNIKIPSFIPIKGDLLKNSDDLTVYLSGQCPYLFSRVKNWELNAKNEEIKFTIVELDSCADAKKGIHPYGTLSVFYKNKILDYRPMATNIVKKLRS